MPCSGNSAAICGGPDALSLYVNGDSLNKGITADYTSIAVSLPAGWSAASTSCLAEGKGGRALTASSWSAGDMTINACLAYCQAAGHQYAGIEYSSECYCGNELRNSASLSLPSTQCNMQCSGAEGTICGGPDSLSLYVNPSLAYVPTAINGYNYQACVAEVGGRALTGASTSSSSMTLESCVSFCSASGFKYAATEYGAECYCGNDFSNGASISTLSTACTMPCAGAAAETCGGPNALSLYALS